jgi:hypothetical protein
MLSVELVTPALLFGVMTLLFGVMTLLFGVMTLLFTAAPPKTVLSVAVVVSVSVTSLFSGVIRL